MSIQTFKAAAIAAIGAFAGFSASGETYTFHSSQQQSGFVGNVFRTSYPTPLQETGGTAITAAPFDFTDQPYDRIASLIDWSLTLTLVDGDTTAADFDYRNVYYYFDGIHSRTYANYFPDGVAFTFTQFNPLTNYNDTLPAITAQLVTDGKLQITLVESRPFPGTNHIEIPASYTATLTINANITPVSEPGPMALLAAGAGVIGWLGARSRRANATA